MQSEHDVIDDQSEVYFPEVYFFFNEYNKPCVSLGRETP